MKTVVVFNKHSKELIACIPMDDSQGIARSDVDIRIYDGNEPVFIDMGEKVFLKENSFIVNL